MHPRCGNAIPRVVVVALLLLVVSPATAPFLTCDFAHLPGDVPQPGFAQAKPVADDVMPAGAAVACSPIARRLDSGARPTSVDRVRRVAPQHVPLRL